MVAEWGSLTRRNGKEESRASRNDYGNQLTRKTGKEMEEGNGAIDRDQEDGCPEVKGRQAGKVSLHPGCAQPLCDDEQQREVQQFLSCPTNCPVMSPLRNLTMSATWLENLRCAIMCLDRTLVFPWSAVNCKCKGRYGQ